VSGREKFCWLMGGVLTLLVIATVVGAVLRARAASDAARALVENLNSRVRAWWVMVAIFAVAFLAGPIATLVLFGCMSFFALREFVTLTSTKPADHVPLFLSFFVLIPLQYGLIGYDWYGLFTILIPVYAFLILPGIPTDISSAPQRSNGPSWSPCTASATRRRCCCCAFPDTRGRMPC
jgi:phosphatidate cytidylyltransferase